MACLFYVLRVCTCYERVMCVCIMYSSYTLITPRIAHVLPLHSSVPGSHREDERDEEHRRQADEGRLPRAAGPPPVERRMLFFFLLL